MSKNVAASSAWAEAYSKPVGAISGLEAVAAQSPSGPVLVPVIDARRGQLYFGFYRREQSRLLRQGDERVAAPEELLAALAQIPEYHEMVLVSPDADMMTRVSAQSPAGMLTYERVSSVLAPTIGQLAYQRAKRGEVVDALTLDANYVRRSDAELHWKGPS